jgi:hypothetical protein
MTLEKLALLAQRSETMSSRTAGRAGGARGQRQGDARPLPPQRRIFKRAAKARRVPYQRMIRALVDAYAERQGEAVVTNCSPHD